MKLNVIALVFLLLAGGCATRSVQSPDKAKAVADTPVSVEAVKAYEAGNKQESLDLYRALVAQEPEHSVYLNNLGVLLLESGQINEALDLFEKASLLVPNNTDYLVNIGSAQLKAGSLEEAMSFFDRVLQLSPGDARAYYGKGIGYMAMKESEIALGLFYRAATLNPDKPEYVFMRAYASQLNSLWEDAIKGYTKYLSLGKVRQKANALSNRALCRFQVKDFDMGMDDLNRALEINDTSSIFYYNKAQGYQMRHDYEHAVKDYTRAIARKAGFPEAYINRGELNYILGNEVKGCSDLKRACDLGFCGRLEKYESSGKCEN